MVILGRPLESELERAKSSLGLGVRRLACVISAILPAWWSWEGILMICWRFERIVLWSWVIEVVVVSVAMSVMVWETQVVLEQ